MRFYQVVMPLVVAAMALAQSSAQVNMDSASLAPNGAPGVDVQVDVSYPPGVSGSLKFNLLRFNVQNQSWVVVSTSESATNTGGLNQQFRVLFNATPQAGDKVEAVVTPDDGTGDSTSNQVTIPAPPE